MAKELKYRPATMAEIEGRDTELYMNGERVYVLMVCRSETIESGESTLDYIMLTNMKKVQVEDLQVIDENNNEPKSEETMTQNMKAADLIGNTIVNKEGTMKYQVKGVAADGETLQVEFVVGDKKPVAMPMPKVQWEKLLAGGWTVGDAPKATATDDVEEVTDIKVEPAKTVDMKPKGDPKKTDKPKARTQGVQKPAAANGKTKSTLKYETYTNRKGKTCARIIGFGENDPAYVNAADLHGSATYERDKDGGKTFYLIFGPRYAEAAKEVCRVLDMGGTVEQAKAIIDKATEERARQRDEWKQKREERKAADDAPKGKTYTEQEVADLIKRVVAGDAEAMRIVNELNKAA